MVLEAELLEISVLRKTVENGHLFHIKKSAFTRLQNIDIISKDVPVKCCNIPFSLLLNNLLDCGA